MFVEAIGWTGVYDYVEFLAEYAPYDLHDLDNFCRAAELYNLGTVIKVDQANNAYVAQRAIGSGFGGVLFVDSRTVDDVAQCVRSVRPDTLGSDGLYGSTPRRFSYAGSLSYSTGGSAADYSQSLRDIVVLIMIEKKVAVDKLEEMLSVPGVDMIQWGPSDYTMSIGKPGQRALPEVKETERRVFQTALRMGVQPRAEIGTPDDAKYYLDMGVRHFNLGYEFFLLRDWWKRNGEALRKAVEG